MDECEGTLLRPMILQKEPHILNEIFILLISTKTNTVSPLSNNAPRLSTDDFCITRCPAIGNDTSAGKSTRCFAVRKMIAYDLSLFNFS